MEEHANDNNYERVCTYLLSCTQYAGDAEEMIKAYRVVYNIYMK